MPPWLCNCLPFLRPRHSRPSPAGSLDDEALPLPRIDSAPALPSRPSSRLGIPGEDTNATATSTSHPSVPGNLIDYQISNGSLVGDRASEHFNAQRQSPQVSRPVTPNRTVPPSAIRTPEPHGPGVQQPTFLASSSNHTESIQAQQLLAPPSPPAIPSQQSLKFDPLIHQNPSMFNQAQNFTVMGGTFIAGNVTHNDLSSDQFMEKFLEKTIPGAEFDSSARDPPPRCHPGTRLDILERCIHFVRTCDGKRKTRWVVGAAGVGKSALLQSIVESPKLVVSCHASVFFSINGRDDGTKAVVTISYQFAAKSEPYRQLIEREITRDPSLLRSSMAKQFLKLIVEPFMHNTQLNPADRILVVIDGLDECKNPHTQLELLQLISNLCIKYHSSPLVWLIASRPEQHITSFFSQSDVAPAYEKEEIAVDSDEACADVERYLRAKLTEIKQKASNTVDPRWPEEQDFWKLANAAGGLFAYADTAVRYIDDVTVGSPASQLSDVLNVIDNHPMTDVPSEDHPMASLDALYARILSSVPSKVMINTRKLLLALVSGWSNNFAFLCNWLGMTPDEAYAALNHLRSVLRVPRRDEAHEEELKIFHKSFMDYISDFRRSGFSHDIEYKARQLMVLCVFRVLNEAPDGIDFGDVDYGTGFGTLRRGPGTGDKISVVWPVDEDVDTTDNMMRLQIYGLAIAEVVAGISSGESAFQSEFCIHIISTRFGVYDEDNFPVESLRAFAFDESRRLEFTMHGILKQMPLKAVNVSPLSNKEAKLQFRRSAKTATNLSDPWNSSCTHERKGKWGEGDDQDWQTSFLPEREEHQRFGECNFCMARFERHLEDWKTRSPDHAVPTFFTSTGQCCVEVRFVDLDDGISEWTYQFWVKLSLKERKKYGSNV